MRTETMIALVVVLTCIAALVMRGIPAHERHKPFPNVVIGQ